MRIQSNLPDLKASLIDISPVISILVDPCLNVIWANNAFELASGKKLEEVEGKKCFEAWDNTEQCRGCQVAQSLISGGQLKSSVSGIGDDNTLNQKGEWIVKSAPVEDPDTHLITGSLVTIFQKSADSESLKRHEKTMSSLMRVVKAGAHLDSQKLLRMFLDEAELLTGSTIGFYHFIEEDQKTISLQTWSTKTIKFCSAPGAGTHYPVSEAGVWADCVKAGQPVIHNNYDSLTHKKGLPEGHVPLSRELVVPVIRGNKLLAILGVGNKETDYDTTDSWTVEQFAAMAWEVIVRKRTEEENELLQEQNVHALKMEAIGRLAGGVAHDFNNMLSVITGRAELGLEDVEPGSLMEENYREILSAAKRSADITRQLLTFARRQPVKPVPINLNDAIQGMLNMLYRFIGENVALEWQPGDDLWITEIDPVQIDQLLANLCINARDAIDDVGKIIITTENITVDDSHCGGNADCIPGEYVTISISDNGCGMDRATRCRIFEPFFTTKEEGRGTGLGLANVYGIVKQSGGFTNVYSEPGSGTTFRIYLPRHSAEFSAQKETITRNVAGGRGETILYVEDEAALLRLTAKLLRNLGYNIITADSPVEALRLVTSTKQNIDLLITDVVMPEMNGKVLSEQIIALFPGMQCLYVSGYTADLIENHGVLVKDTHFVQKPYTKRVLAEKIRSILDTR